MINSNFQTQGKSQELNDQDRKLRKKYHKKMFKN